MRNEPSRVAGSGAAFPRAINRASHRQTGSPPLPTQESLPLHTASPCFGKSLLLRSSQSLNLVHQRIQEERQETRHGSVTDCGANGRAFQGCVRFKSLEDLALDVVGRTVARVSAEEHMANYRAARALMGKGKKAKPKK